MTVSSLVKDEDLVNFLSQKNRDNDDDNDKTTDARCAESVSVQNSNTTQETLNSTLNDKSSFQTTSQNFNSFKQNFQKHDDSQNDYNDITQPTTSSPTLQHQQKNHQQQFNQKIGKKLDKRLEIDNECCQIPTQFSNSWASMHLPNTPLDNLHASHNGYFSNNFAMHLANSQAAQALQHQLWHDYIASQNHQRVSSAYLNHGCSRIHPQSNFVDFCELENPTASENNSGLKKNQQQTARIKRPMNAFMVWSRDERKKLAKENPDQENSAISKMLGLKWRDMSDEKKKPYRDAAIQLSESHSISHPDYKYRPRRKNRSKFNGFRDEETVEEQQQKQQHGRNGNHTQKLAAKQKTLSSGSVSSNQRQQLGGYTRIGQYSRQFLSARDECRDRWWRGCYDDEDIEKNSHDGQERLLRANVRKSAKCDFDIINRCPENNLHHGNCCSICSNNSYPRCYRQCVPPVGPAKKLYFINKNNLLVNSIRYYYKPKEYYATKSKQAGNKKMEYASRHVGVQTKNQSCKSIRPERQFSKVKNCRLDDEQISQGDVTILNEQRVAEEIFIACNNLYSYSLNEYDSNNENQNPYFFD